MSTGICLPNSQLLLLMLLTVPASRSEKNVALTGTATQSADQDSRWTADNAIDDCTSNYIASDCCAHTKVEGAKEAWWRVDLGEPRTIQYITIHNRQNARGRFAGYQLFLSNTTNYQQGIICYKDNSIEVADLQMDPTHQCPYVAQYVTIYNHRDDTNRPSWYDEYAVLELCEVQVFGCTSGKYGNGNCDNTCPQKCFGGNCDAIKGHCFYCFAGRFGDGCDQHCSNNCSSACEKDSGHCLGCIPGKRGELCNNRCPSTCVTCHQKSEQCFECVHGKYGNLCELDCSENCKNKSCGKDSGHCLECILGKRGDLCDTSCPINCVTCDQTSPECFGCIHGKYGQDCTLDCLGICKNNACQQSGGECTACPPGKYGSLCNKNCSTNCFECDFSSGACDVCQNGYFGQDCTFHCETNCKICERSGGNCTECVDGLYGSNCSIPCGQCDKCIKDTGHCLSVCNIGYEGVVCQTRTMVPEPSGVNAGTVVAIVVSLLVVTALVVVILYFIKRRRQKASEGEKHDDMGLQRMDKDKLNRNNDIGNVDENVYTIAEDDSDVEHAVQTQTEHGSVIYANTGDQVDDTTEITYHTVGIAVTNLKAVVKTKMDNKAKALEDEYMALPSGNLHAHNVGKKTGNKGKNRYKTTFPYDHSRVVLEKVDDDEHSDYINANYIHSVISPAQYIATQGPLEKTVDDFWRMIWQQESSKIVMLTNLIEGSKKKCAKYWPDEGEPLTTKHFSVVLDRERVYAFYAIRDINVTEKKTYSVRQVQHFHFTTWPDHGIPDSNELVVFHRRVMQQNTGKGKMVVHCSAGIGRTGTFIALDALLNYGREFGIIDVMEYIVTMRKDRINMVQTSSQYIALHHILTEAFDMPDTLISRLKYHTALDSMRSDTAENQTKIRREYQLTQVMKPTYDARDYQTAMLPVNRQKNRNSDVLAVDRFRAYLTTSTRNRTDYINAVRVPSYLSRTGFIVTQTPLEDTVVDLLTMLIDYQCDTLVIIEKDRVDWLPEEDGDKTIGAFTLKRKGGSPRQSNTEFIDVSISNQDTSYSGRDAEIRVFHVSDWNRELSVPPHSRSILLLLELLDRRRQENALKTTVVMCRDGCTQCGLFCCISNAREQMNIDDEVDIFQVSRQLLIRRPEFIISFDQYQSCYNMIKDYLDTIEICIN